VLFIGPSFPSDEVHDLGAVEQQPCADLVDGAGKLPGPEVAVSGALTDTQQAADFD
jgi:hypothetical protein